MRDIEHEVERIVAVTADGAWIEEGDLSPDLVEERVVTEGGSLSEVVEQVERRMIREALARCEGNKSKTARLLRISRRGLLNKLERYDIS